MTYSYRFYQSIETVNLKDWQQIAQLNPEKICLDYRFLISLEKSMSDVSQFWYVIFYDETGIPQACACLSTYQTDLTIIAHASVKTIIQLIRRFFPNWLYWNILFCGLPVSIGHNALGFSSAVDHAEILRQLDQLMQTIASQEKAKLIVFKEFREQEYQQIQALEKLGYLGLESLPMNLFPTKFTNFNHYYQSLRSNYRKHIKKSRKKIEKSRLIIKYIQGKESVLSHYQNKEHLLYQSVIEKSKTQLEILPKSFFDEIANQFPEEVSMVVALRNNNIVGYIFCLRINTIFYALFCGFEQSLNRHTDLYFNLAYGVIKNALNAQVSHIELGQTADYFKARLGAYQIPLKLSVKSPIRIINILITLFPDLLFPKPNIAPTFHVFNCDD